MMMLCYLQSQITLLDLPVFKSIQPDVSTAHGQSSYVERESYGCMSFQVVVFVGVDSNKMEMIRNTVMSDYKSK